ncbi:YciI family protein [Kangiella sp. HZ709]|uniref:YciI family protein n=1 Tax=Kangiella sp. HZ709 TaxID=2666328 RepID=UPI0012B03934|nr:YciI family protein [Kangiella sp. HZ709]MRX27273.1 hypothetical protein [Kangiella sp. HZ709]
MKLFKLIFLSTFLFSAIACQAGQPSQKAQAINVSYNAELAKELGADDYGMKSYVMVVLNTGPEDSKITDKERRAKLFKGHFDNMGRLAEQGKLVLAGPLAGNKPKRGLFIFNVKTIEEAEELVKTDPTVMAGIFTYELTRYYGSAALMKVNAIHKTLQKQKI